MISLGILIKNSINIAFVWEHFLVRQRPLQNHEFSDQLGQSNISDKFGFVLFTQFLVDVHHSFRKQILKESNTFFSKNIYDFFDA